MLDEKVSRLRTWVVGMRVHVSDNLGLEEPLWAHVVEIAEDLSAFLVRWDESGRLGWQAVEDIHLFETD